MFAKINSSSALDLGLQQFIDYIYIANNDEYHRKIKYIVFLSQQILYFYVVCVCVCFMCVSLLLTVERTVFLTASTFEIVTKKHICILKRVKVRNIQLKLYVCTAHTLLTFFS